MRHPLRTHCILFFLFLTGTTFLAAQSGDIQLTHDPQVIYLPHTIQASAEKDGDVLVVWNTSYRDQDDSVRLGLVGQIVRDGEAAGTPRLIHTPAARPLGRVFIVPFDNGYRVIWNDDREGKEAAYVRSLTPDGVPSIAPEEVFSTGYIDKLYTHGSPGDGGVLLYWSDFSFRLPSVAVRMRADGVFESAPIVLDSPIREIFAISEGRLVMQLVDSTGYVVERNGQRSDRPLSKHLFGMFTVLQDGGICTIRDSVVNYYRDPFSDEASASVVWPELNMATGSMGIASRDGAGNFRLLYFVHEGFAPPRSSNSFGYFEFGDTLYDVRISDNGQELYRTKTLMRSGTVYLRIPSDYSGYSWNYLEYGGGSVVNRCAGTVMTAIWNEIHTTGSTRPNIVSDTIAISLIDTALYLNRAADSVACRPIFPLVIRKSDSLFSRVMLVYEGDSVELTAQGIQRPQISQTRPALTVRNDTMVLTMQHADVNNTFEAARVEDFANGMVTSFGVARLTTLPAVNNSFGGLLEHTGGQSLHDLVRGPNVAFVWSALERFNSWYLRTGNYSDYSYPTYTDKFEIHLASTIGWQRSDETFGPLNFNDYYAVYTPHFDSWGWNPNDSTLLVRYYRDQHGGVSLGRFDVDGRTVWSRTNVKSVRTGLVIPGSGSKYLVVAQDSVYSYSDTTVIGSFTLPTTPDPSSFTYIRLLGDRFLRYSRLDSKSLRLELYSMAGKALGVRVLNLPPEARDLFLVQGGANALLAVLWSADGIHAAFLSQNLGLVEEDVRISETAGRTAFPTGVFRHDTLFVAWTDYRNWKSDIYGSVIVPPVPAVAFPGLDRYPGLASGTESFSEVSYVEGAGVDSSVPGLQAYPTPPLLWEKLGRIELFPIPNPTSGRTDLRFILRQESDVTVRLYDELGRTVWRYTEESLGSGTQWIPLDLSNERPGVYTVVLTAGEAVGVGRIVRRP